MPRSKKRALFTFGVIVALLLYPCFQLFRLASAAQAIETTIQTGKALSNPSRAQIDQSLGAVALNLGIVQLVTHDPAMEGLAYLPGISDEWKALQSTSGSLAELVHSAEATYGASLAIANSGAGLSVNSHAIRPFANSLAELNAKVASAGRALDAVSFSKLKFGLSPIFRRVRHELRTLNQPLNQLVPLAQVAAAMLSDPATHRWFVANQNLAETRGTGGLIGSYLVLETHNGKIRLIESGSDKDLALRYPIPASSQSQAFISDWGIQRGLWIDMDASGDLPTAAKTISSAWTGKRHEPLAGVLFIGQGTMAHLLALIGSVQVDGHTLTYQNASEYLAKTVYTDYPDYRKKDLFVQSFSRNLTKKLASVRPNLSDFWKSASSTRSGDYPLVWATSANLENEILRLGLAGSVSTLYGHNPKLIINNAGGNKLDSYLRIQASYKFQKCGYMTSNGLPGVQAQAFVTLTNSAPASALPEYVWPAVPTNTKIGGKANSMHQLVTLYAPVGSDDQSFSVNGEEEFVQFGFEKNRPKYSLRVSIGSGESKALKFTWIEPLVDENGKPLKRNLRFTLPPTFNRPSLNVDNKVSCSFGKTAP
jgi:hypothetical protein